MKNRKVVITYGTFDLFHYGHENILKSARKLGDFLIVGLSTDEFNRIKGKEAYDSFETRYEKLINSGLVDMIIPEDNWEQKINDIKKYNVSIFVMGSDWKGRFDFLDQYCKINYPKRTEGISSTMLREKMKSVIKKIEYPKINVFLNNGK